MWRTRNGYIAIGESADYYKGKPHQFLPRYGAFETMMTSHHRDDLSAGWRQSEACERRQTMSACHGPVPESPSQRLLLVFHLSCSSHRLAYTDYVRAWTSACVAGESSADLGPAGMTGPKKWSDLPTCDAGRLSGIVHTEQHPPDNLDPVYWGCAPANSSLPLMSDAPYWQLILVAPSDSPLEYLAHQPAE